MLAEDDDTIYVAFMGTKQRRDLVANAAVLQVPLWPKEKGNSNVISPISFCLFSFCLFSLCCGSSLSKRKPSYWTI